ncbi:RHS repeat-associated core domain-containing protein [Rheinheimera muenzenbergensis]|uniref:RHS repeat-associated core domain-containing protein n=1 Tax=Rheinheimera muenzenbergensis TaxID=1193628 RepID=A0ABU8CCF4_9GAMM
MVKRHVTEQGSTKTIFQHGGVELIKEGSSTTIRRNIGNALVERSGNSITTRYVYTDHLGSVDVITDDKGLIEQKLSFDAFGKRRMVFTPSHQPVALTLAAILNRTHRGFTGHLQVDHASIIHMGGRIYDSHIGRFLQADPFVQAPSNSQSHNRYSYVLNNPLSYTDPSGYFWSKLKQWAGVIIGVVVSIYCLACGASILNAALTGAAIGAGMAALNGGNIIKGALIGAFSGAAFYQIGANFNANSGFWAEGGLAHIGAHGLTGGVTSVLQGGKFGHGFISAGLSKAVNINKIFGTAGKDAPLRIVSAAVIGGSISKISGGKFSNGATTAAFAQLFNAERRNRIDEAMAKADEEIAAQAGSWKTEDDAAKAFAKATASISAELNVEMGATIYNRDGVIGISKVYTDYKRGWVTPRDLDDNATALIHTHGRPSTADLEFSPEDYEYFINKSIELGRPISGYLALPGRYGVHKFNTAGYLSTPEAYRGTSLHCSNISNASLSCYGSGGY